MPKNHKSKYIGINDFKEIMISIKSPEEILKTSCGEVLKPETINYKTGKPEKDGLFCEKIFGPVKDWTCSCGAYVNSYNTNKKCERCGVMVTKSTVRRERYGHIELQFPVVHILFVKSNSSILSTLLNIPVKTLEDIIYFVSYVVIDPKNTPFKKYDILSEREYKDVLNEYGLDGIDISIGGEAILRMLESIDLDVEIAEMREVLSKKKNLKLVKRLSMFQDMKEKGIRPEWVVLKRIPVIPPDVRPIVQVAGGKFATSDVNDLYRRVLSRNQRLKKMAYEFTPEVIIRNEKRLLQDAVDCLFANSKKDNPIKANNGGGSNGRVLKSISDTISGKKGVFRGTLLGKRVDYSGRSVIVVGPSLKMNQVGIPKTMALELCKPYVIRELIERGITDKIRPARQMIESHDSRVWDVLEEVIIGKPVLLNRAPTLHRLSIQGFDMVLVEGDAIELHPLVCSAFNADFDGDQMAVHLPLGEKARKETYGLMYAPNNILNPKDGQTIAVPSQDMVIGLYCLTLEDESDKIRYYKDEDAAIKAYDLKKISLNERILVNSERAGGRAITTVGKIIFSEIFPKDFEFINESLFEKIETFDGLEEKIKSKEYKEPFGKKGQIKKIINKVYDKYGQDVTVNVTDEMKSLGFKYATLYGVTIGMEDIIIPEEKYKVVSDCEEKVSYINELYGNGFLTEEERYNATVNLWQVETDKLTNLMMRNYEKNHRKNPLYMMVNSGARGSKDQVKQLSSMRGLMSSTSGKIIEFPVKSNFKEGIDVLDFYTSAHGARKGGVDTALKTSDSGYLTRKLVDVAQSVIIEMDDCGSEGFYTAKNIISDGTLIKTMEDIVEGRYSAEDVKDSEGNVLVSRNELITKNIAQLISSKGIEEVKIRVANKCNCGDGVCRKCYGVDLSNWKPVRLGTAVGIIAAQSIGEPGTQLTMRTFHNGGIAGNDITQGLPRVDQLVEASIPGDKVPAFISPIDGTVSIEDNGRVRKIFVRNDENSWSENIPTNAGLFVKEGELVERGKILTTGALKLQEALDILGKEFVEEYILNEILKVYAGEGVSIDNKHIEIIIKQMMRRVTIDNPGDSMFENGQVVDIDDFKTVSELLTKEGKEPPTMTQNVTGIKKVAINAKSYFAAASFQEAGRILTEAAIRGKVDTLKGLKENLIIGRLIPCGTGFSSHYDVPEEEKYLDI